MFVASANHQVQVQVEHQLPDKKCFPTYKNISKVAILLQVLFRFQ